MPHKKKVQKKKPSSVKKGNEKLLPAKEEVFNDESNQKENEDSV